jgi:hypothetical protein
VKAELHLSAHSGVIAASLAANSVLFAHHNPATLADGSTNRRAQRLKMLIAKWRTITGYTVEQELSLAAYEVTSFDSADYTGGTDLSHPTTDANKAYRMLGPESGLPERRSGVDTQSVLQSGNVRIASTAGLSHAGTPAIKTHPFAWNSWLELATGATIQRGAVDMVWTPSVEGQNNQKGLMIYPDKGFVIRNPIALGAGGTGRLFVELVLEEA